MRRRPGKKLGTRVAALFAVALGSPLLAQEALPRSGDVVRSPGNAEWAKTPDEAKARAAAQQKFVYIEFDKPECGHCQRMDKLTYPAMDFEALLIPMVPTKVSLESPEGKELARRYNIQDAPAVLVTTPEGRLVFLMEGFTSTQEFYARIYEDLATYRAFAKKVEAQDIGNLPPREALDSGSELFQRSDPASALPRLRRAVAAPKSSAAIRDEALEILAGVEFELGQIDASRKTINRLIASTKDAIRKERAELFRAQIPLAENRPQEALALYRKFLSDHPKSPFVPQVNKMLERLTSTP